MHTDETTKLRAMDYLAKLRASGISADMDYMDRSMKARMKAAARSGAVYAMIVEPGENAVSARDMARSEQQLLSFDGFVELLSTMENGT